MVLDDDADTRHINAWRLNKAFPGCHVTEVGTVREALSAAEGTHFNAVLTDHHLGEGNGAELIRALRERGVTCPVLMVTNSCDPKLHQQALEAGATRVFGGSDMNFAGYLRDVLAAGQ